MANVTLTSRTKPQDEMPAAVARFRHALRDAEWNVDRLMADLSREEELLGEFPIVHGAAIHCDPSGTLRVHAFGNAGHPIDSVRNGWRDALVTWSKHDMDGTIDFWCEMPGVAKEDIEIEMGSTTVKIEARSRFFNYRATCTPGFLLDPQRVDAHYENGLLEATVWLETASSAVLKKIQIA